MKFHPAKKQKISEIRCQCGKATPSFNVPGETVAIWCSKCHQKPMNAIDVKHKKCQCGKKRPVFNVPGETTAIWCFNCPQKPMHAVDVKNKKCQCGKARPSLNIPGETVAIWCFNCPQKSMNAIDVKNKKCQCGKARPSLNIPGETVAIWCFNCPQKPMDAVDVSNKKCQCGKKRPTFNVPGETAAIWCSRCPEKPMNAVDVKSKKCQCGKAQACFNILGETIAVWCFNCPQRPMNTIDVKHKKCQCGKAQPSLNIPGGTVAIWCFNCPQKPMDAVDVKNKKCQCGKAQPQFNIPGQSPRYCSFCCLSGMVYHPKKKCTACKNLAIYGIHSRQRCEEHKQKNDFNLVEYKCASCGLLEVLDANKKCSTCDPTRFNEYLKRKENQIRDFLVVNNILFTQDKIANGGTCGKERPDFVIYLNERVIIIEVDEEQHANYPCECEQIRMINVTQSFGGMYVFWIRYNPDSFKTNKQRMLVSDMKRQLHLLEWIKFGSYKTISNLSDVVYLFYDGCQEKTAPTDVHMLC